MTTENIKTRIYKAIDGWTAESITKLEGTDKYLNVTTTKGINGRLYTSASAVEIEGHIVRFAVFSDFRKTLKVYDKGIRATEKTITALHTEALQGLQAIIEEAKGFYAPAVQG